MSSVYKLSISGIRSFSDESQETIQFGKPLTLIVGTNGSGKTTIIECLRYTTTGELPPNTSKGASFINDPSLHASNSTKAQIKLAFQNVNHVSMILSKSLMATRKPKSNRVSFQTRENQLMAIHNGERQTVSSKVADIEQLIPAQLGVSQAVLTYVIFCHQDDSLWPISDSATLKKRFDEIFDSVKFIKALEEMKSTSKELNVEIKVLTNDVDHLRNDKVRASQKRDEMQRLKLQVDSINDEMGTIQLSIDDDNKKIEELYTTKQDYERTLSRLESLSHEQKSLEDHIERIRTTTEILQEPPESLQAKLNDFANVVVKERKEAERLQGQISSKTLELENARAGYNDSTYEKGRLEGMRDKYEQNKAQLAQFPTQSRADLITMQQELNSKQQELDDKNEDYGFELSALKEEITKESQNSSYLSSDLAKCKETKSKLQTELAGMSDNSVKLKNSKTELTLKEKELEEFKASCSGASAVESLREAVRKNEYNLEEIRRKMGLARQNDEVSSKVGVLKDMNKKAMAQIEGTVMRLKEVGVDPATYTQQQLDAKAEVTSCRSTLEALKVSSAELKSLIASQNEANEALLAKQRGVQSQFSKVATQYAAIYSDQLTLDNYKESLNEVEDDYDADFATVKNHEAYVAFNTRAIEIAKAKNACSLCHREFHNHEKSKFFEILEQQNKKLSDSTEAVKLLKQKEELMKDMRDIDVSVLKEEPAATDEVKLQSVEREITVASDKLDDAIQNEARLSGYSNEVSSLEKLRADIDERTLQVSQMIGDIQDLGYLYEDLEKDDTDLRKKLSEAKARLDEATADRELKNVKMARMNEAINELRLALKNLEIQSLEKVNIEKTLEETGRKADGLKASLDLSEEKRAKLQGTWDEKNACYQEEKKCLEVAVADLTGKVNDLKAQQSQYTTLESQIKEYETEYAPRLESIEQKVQAYQDQMEKLQPEITSLNESLGVLDDKIKNASNQERTIRDNIDLLQSEAQLVELKASISDLDVKKAEAERDRYVARGAKLQQEQMAHRERMSEMVGERNQIQKQIEGIEQEIGRDYHDVDSKYAEQYAKLQTKMALVTDLATCYKATDDGIMRFHQQKMQEINRSIDEIWKRTYTGNDVESIMIKADPAPSGVRTRSYNYRVVMVKNGVELDMRGRCSAGQRVLASIIIRLALAECFGLNFGMLALDEPTTNLDEENIESLAHALRAIIEMRSVQRNFQLIVITHDEKFLRYMNAVKFTDHYYKVARDERLHSTISKVRITALE